MELDDLAESLAYQIYLRVKSSSLRDRISFEYFGPTTFSVSVDNETYIQRLMGFWYRWKLMPEPTLLKFSTLEDALLYRDNLSVREFSKLEWHRFQIEATRTLLQKSGWFECDDDEVRLPVLSAETQDVTFIPWPFPCSGLPRLVLDHIIAKQVRAFMSKRTDTWYTSSMVGNYYKCNRVNPPDWFPFGFTYDENPFLVSETSSHVACFQFYEKRLVIQSTDKAFVEALTPPSVKEFEKIVETYK